ncbi:unnamed protein product [Absidia cylindrospora]
MNFKDLQFSLGKLSSDVKSHMAKNNPLHKQDTKALSVWIFQERNDLATMRTLAYRRGETTKSFREWTTNDHGNGTMKMSIQIFRILAISWRLYSQKQMKLNNTRYQQYRHAIKSIREREDALCDRREKRNSLSARLVHLQKTNPKSPRRHEIEAELVALDNDTQLAEMELGDFKRFALQEAFYIRFNAMTEYAEKMKMVAGFGKYIVDLLDVEPTASVGTTTTTDQQQQHDEPITHNNDTSPPTRKPYTSESQANLILNDCLLAIDQWEPSEEDERPTLANQAIHEASNDEDANLLTEEDIRYYREQGLASLTSLQIDNTTKIMEATGNEQQQQPPTYNREMEKDADKWNDEKCTQWKTEQHQQQDHAPPSSLVEASGKENTLTHSDILPPAYTPDIIKSPLPTTTIHDHTKNTAAAAAGTKLDSGSPTATTSNTTTGASHISSSSTTLTHEPQISQMNYYQVYRNKQLLLSSHPSRPYVNFLQQFVNNSIKKINP